MEQLFAQYQQWREKTDREPINEDSDMNDKKAFMKYAKIKRLDDDDFEELEMQYDEYLIEQETFDEEEE